MSQHVFMIVTQVICAALIVALLTSGAIMEKFSLKRFNVKNIALLGMLVALSVVLTNFVGYAMLFGRKIMVGNFIMFLTGMMFGPLSGMVAGISSDITGSILNSGGGFHFGFMLIKVMIGFAGSLVFFNKNTKYWIPKMVLIYTICIILHLFVIHPIAISALYGSSIAAVNWISKLILLPIQVVVYPFLTYSCFMVLFIFIRNDVGKPNSAWVGRHGEVKFTFKPKISEAEKIQIRKEKREKAEKAKSHKKVKEL
ncbi:folate family ECF transporter S component [[Acholeplasma] multilocale]|uniref:folate family ECF transporter S component n=1 Tax=[Acholeplasma] multilocale TaxID=264638 RepID=UPI000687443E|nr:folate family ECF transporter S component [[Acholeplasma] multilocale]